MLNVIALAFALATSVTPTNTTDTTSTISTQKVERSSVAQVAVIEEVEEATQKNLVSTSEEVEGVTQKNLATTSEETIEEADSTMVEYLRPNVYYFTDPDGIVWEFQMKYNIPVGIKPESPEFFEYMDEHLWYPKSLIFRKHVGELPNVYIPTAAEMLEVPSGGKTVTNSKGKEIPYKLCPNSLLPYIVLRDWAERFAHLDATPIWPEDYAAYDYNLDGKMGIEDLVEMAKRLFSSPCSWLCQGEDYEGISWTQDFLPVLEENSEKGQFEWVNPE